MTNGHALLAQTVPVKLSSVQLRTLHIFSGFDLPLTSRRTLQSKKMTRRAIVSSPLVDDICSMNTKSSTNEPIVIAVSNICNSDRTVYIVITKTKSPTVARVGRPYTVLRSRKESDFSESDSSPIYMLYGDGAIGPISNATINARIQ